MQAYVLTDPRHADDATIRVAVLDEKVPEGLMADVECEIRSRFGHLLERIEDKSIELVLYFKQNIRLDELADRVSKVVLAIITRYDPGRRPSATPPRTVRDNAALRGAH